MRIQPLSKPSLAEVEAEDEVFQVLNVGAPDEANRGFDAEVGAADQRSSLRAKEAARKAESRDALPGMPTCGLWKM